LKPRCGNSRPSVLRNLSFNSGIVHPRNPPGLDRQQYRALLSSSHSLKGTSNENGGLVTITSPRKESTVLFQSAKSLDTGRSRVTRTFKKPIERKALGISLSVPSGKMSAGQRIGVDMADLPYPATTLPTS
jgi:hypothetical protein